MRLVWTLDAYHDRENIYDYIKAEEPIAARSLGMRFEEAAGHLAEHPQASRLERVPGTRKLVAHRHYVLVYYLLENAVRTQRGNGHHEEKSSSAKWKPKPGDNGDKYSIHKKQENDI